MSIKWIIQLALSELNGGWSKILHRSGSSITAFEGGWAAFGGNCTAFCARRLEMDSLSAGGHDPALVLCCDAFSAAPLNGLRVAFPSQMGTADTDPSLPFINNTGQIDQCWRMFNSSNLLTSSRLYSILKSKVIFPFILRFWTYFWTVHSFMCCYKSLVLWISDENRFYLETWGLRGFWNLVWGHFR